MEQQRFVVVSALRTHGYTVQDTWRQATWFKGPDCTAGWYKHKADAQHRADVYNKASEEGRFRN